MAQQSMILRSGPSACSLVTRVNKSRQNVTSKIPNLPQRIVRCSQQVQEDSSAQVRVDGPSDYSTRLLSSTVDESQENVDRTERRKADGQGSGFRLMSTAVLAIPALAEEFTSSYSQASYYASLGLFLVSLPGLWSLIKRSVRSKIVRKTFEIPGPAASGAKPLGQLAGEITAFLTRNNFKITDRGEVVKFEGNIEPSRSQAAFLTFCTALSLGSVALVLTVTNPEVGDWWYSLMALSPLAGAYYWSKAARKEEIQVKMVIADDESTTDVIIQGSEEEIDRLRRELQLMEKGMIYVKGIFEM